MSVSDSSGYGINSSGNESNVSQLLHESQNFSADSGKDGMQGHTALGDMSFQQAMFQNNLNVSYQTGQILEKPTI